MITLFKVNHYLTIVYLNGDEWQTLPCNREDILLLLEFSKKVKGSTLRKMKTEIFVNILQHII